MTMILLLCTTLRLGARGGMVAWQRGDVRLVVDVVPGNNILLRLVRVGAPRGAGPPVP